LNRHAPLTCQAECRELAMQIHVPPAVQEQLAAAMAKEGRCGVARGGRWAWEGDKKKKRLRGQ